MKMRLKISSAMWRPFCPGGGGAFCPGGGGGGGKTWQYVNCMCEYWYFVFIVVKKQKEEGVYTVWSTDKHHYNRWYNMHLFTCSLIFLT